MVLWGESIGDDCDNDGRDDAVVDVDDDDDDVGRDDAVVNVDDDDDAVGGRQRLELGHLGEETGAQWDNAHLHICTV